VLVVMVVVWEVSLIYVLHFVFIRLFLSFLPLKCHNLILGVSYPWDIQRPRFIEVSGIPGSNMSKGKEMVGN